MITINLCLDPGNIFSGVEKTIAEYLNQGTNVTGAANINERSLQREIVSKCVNNPSTIIWGSSRIMEVGSSTYGNGTYNNSVSGASLEDLIGIYQLYINEEKAPKRIIISIDPWIFNKNNEQYRWETLKNEYNSFFNSSKNQVISPALRSYLELVSPSYFQASIKLLKKNIKVNIQEKQVIRRIIEPSHLNDNEFFTRISDGTISYGARYRNLSNEEIIKNAKDFITSDLYSLENYNEISDDLFNVFSDFVQNIKKKNIDLEFLLLPYHPIVYDYIFENDKYSQVLEVEYIMKDFAKENKINITGSYNPGLYKLTNNDFYDGMHMNRKGLYKFFKNKH